MRKIALFSGYALVASGIGFPVFSFISFRKTLKKQIFFPADLRQAAVNFKEGVFLLTSPSGFNALSARCPHLGCTVNFDALAKKFKCPCHGSTFDSDGKWISGPARKDLQPLPLEEKPNGDVEVILKT